MEPYQRIKFLIDITSDGNKTSFAKKVNAKPQTINTLIQRQGKPSFSLVEDILKAFPNLSADWLIKGEGDVGLDKEVNNYEYKSGLNIHLKERIVEEEHPSRGKDDTKDVEKLLARIRSLEREIELLKDNVESQHETIKAKNLLIEHFQKMMK